MTKVTRVRYYVDGLNLYYGIARPYQCKWIDLQKLLSTIISDKLPNHQTEKVIVFTSEVQGKAADRQKIYLRALQEHSPNIEIIYGRFRTRQKWGESYTDGELHQFDVSEEKGTDVNIACRMVDDAHRLSKGEEKSFDVACLVSNDSDLAFALEVKNRLRQRVVLITPRAERADSYVANDLKKHVKKKDRILTIKKDVVQRCALPLDVNGNMPPPEWR